MSDEIQIIEGEWAAKKSCRAVNEKPGDLFPTICNQPPGHDKGENKTPHGITKYVGTYPDMKPTLTEEWT